eukprot:c19128_g1_i3.p1 GENE.c19128_g1_i3~~c19128_g1_i3.p1  ORF type:complete len:166 (+),score=45.73 c19128_g1_i3:195-692(+)
MVIESDEEGKPVLELYHSFKNSRASHMNAPGRHDHERDHHGVEGGCCDHDHDHEHGDEHDHEHGEDDDHHKKHTHSHAHEKGGKKAEVPEEQDDEEDEDDDDSDEHDQHDAPPCLTYPVSFAPALAKLFADYPQFTSIKSLPIDSQEDKLAFATGLVLERVVELK